MSVGEHVVSLPLDVRLFDIETKVSVNLYAVSAQGYTVVCDTWIENRVDCWEVDHGIYARKTVAEWKRDDVIRSLEIQGYRPGWIDGLFVKGYREAKLHIDHMQVSPAEISLDGFGECTYKGARVIL